ncbi:MAG: hypothetical protein ACLUVG_06845 [Phocaeicola vulgatus]
MWRHGSGSRFITSIPTGGMGFGSLGGQYVSGAIINGTANRDIKWDTTIKQNFGLDMNVLDNRLSITTDFYYDKTKDLIMFVSDPRGTHLYWF